MNTNHILQLFCFPPPVMPLGAIPIMGVGAKGRDSSMTKAIKTDDVYQAHKDRVAAINEKYTNGGIDYIEQLK